MQPDELVRFIVSSLANSEVEVITQTSSSASAIKVIVAKSDMLKVIGVKGQNATSMRILLTAIGKKTEHKYTLDIVERDESI